MLICVQSNRLLYNLILTTYVTKVNKNKQKQTKSEARNNIAQMSKENVDKMMENGYFGFGADSSLNEEMDNALDNIASHHEEILDSEMDTDFDYDEFSEFIEILLSLSPENIESDSKIADAISLCQQVVDRFLKFYRALSISPQKILKN